ncbi:hypothetical protein LVD15_20800 [Fulvivirga maritima]|uniref:cyclophilin-like fold protein n=1 Tax=Fulvivirga maritima TaxID=2904247 RepID=UPI001EEDC5EE|nr:cyclophilin-like fold protein [Fulvivirga maritima]UII25722.1 hypothetical protein LVD15_20800 [Fulvivirga maritima]
MKSLSFISLLCIISFTACTQNKDKQTTHKQEILQNMKLKIKIGEVELTATMYDNPTTKDFISMLPISTPLKDYASNEKIFYPERKLSTADAPSGYEAAKGDITYYAPWGDIAIFYKDFSYAGGLISLGKIDDNRIEQLKTLSGDKEVTFELAD